MTKTPSPSAPPAEAPLGFGLEQTCADEGRLARTAKVSLAGTVAKALHPVFLVAAVHLYGLAAYGRFAVGVVAMELLLSFVAGGYRVGIIMYGGRHNHSTARSQQVYVALANGLVISGLLSVFVSAVLILVSSMVAGSAVASVVRVLAFALPFMVLVELAVAATKSRMIMRFDALLLGLARPLLLLGFAVLGHLLRPAASSLLWAYVGAYVVLAVLASIAFARHFDRVRTVHALVNFRFSPKLAAFAASQSAHLTLANSATRIDVLMLSSFGLPSESVGLYDVAGKLVRMLRQVKQGFAKALAPLVARYDEEGQLAALQSIYTRVNDWSAALAFALVLLLLGVGADVLAAVVPGAAAPQRVGLAFAFVLAVHPLLSATFGLSGNVLVMAGHSRVALLNSAAFTAINVVLNFTLIPSYGLLGAASASAVASVLLHLALWIELRQVLGLRLAPRAAPYLSLAVGLFALIVLQRYLDSERVWWIAAMTTAAAIVIYGGALRLFWRGEATAPKRLSAA